MRKGYTTIHYPKDATDQGNVPAGSLALLSGETVIKVKLSDGTFIPLTGVSDITEFGRDIVDLANITELKVLLGLATAWQPTALTRRVDVDFTSVGIGAIESVNNTGSISGVFSQVTTSKQPTGVDFLTYRGASFDGTDYMSGQNGWNVTTNYAFFIVFSYDYTPPEQQYLYAGHSITGRIPHAVGSRSTTGNLIGPSHNISDVLHVGSGIEPNYGAIDFIYCSYDGANFHTKLNGSVDSLVADTAAPEPGYNTIGVIGTNGSYTDYLKGKIFRVIGFATHQSDTDIAKMEGWAAWEFDRVDMLPSNHTYKNVRPLV